MKLFTLLRIEKPGRPERLRPASSSGSGLFPWAVELTLTRGASAAPKVEALQNQKIRRRAPKADRGAAEPRAAALPSREELIAFIGGAPAPNGERAPARVTKRDIARAFGVKGEAKAELKLLIKDLQAEGAVARGRKALTVQGRLPSLVVADIAERDRDGELIARPAEWSEEGPAPRILVRRSRGKRERAPAPGPRRARADAGRVRRRRRREAPAYSGRVVKILDKLKARAFAVYRAADDGSGRALPVEKRGGGARNFVPAAMAGEARGRRSRRDRAVARGTHRAPAARVVETMGSVKSERAVSLIALATHHIPHVFSPAALKEAEARARFASPAARGLAGAAARHHRSAGRQGSRRRGPRRGRSRSGQPRRLHRHRRHRRRRGLRSPRLGARPRGARTRQLGLFPRPGRADAARAHLQRSLLAASARGPAGARGAHDPRRRRPQALAHVPPHHDALGRQAVLRAGQARDRRAAGRDDGAAPRERAEAALCRACGDQDRARTARSARSRPARAQARSRQARGGSMACDGRSGSKRTG